MSISPVSQYSVIGNSSCAPAALAATRAATVAVSVAAIVVLRIMRIVQLRSWYRVVLSVQRCGGVVVAGGLVAGGLVAGGLVAGGRPWPCSCRRRSFASSIARR